MPAADNHGPGRAGHERGKEQQHAVKEARETLKPVEAQSQAEQGAATVRRGIGKKLRHGHSPEHGCCNRIPAGCRMSCEKPCAERGQEEHAQGDGNTADEKQ